MVNSFAEAVVDGPPPRDKPFSWLTGEEPEAGWRGGLGTSPPSFFSKSAPRPDPEVGAEPDPGVGSAASSNSVH